MAFSITMACVHVCMCVHVHTRTLTHASMHVRTHMHTHACMHDTRMDALLHTHTYTGKLYLYPTEAILQRHLQCNISDARQVLGNNYLLGSYSPVQC